MRCFEPFDGFGGPDPAGEGEIGVGDGPGGPGAEEPGQLLVPAREGVGGRAVDVDAADHVWPGEDGQRQRAAHTAALAPGCEQLPATLVQEVLVVHRDRRPGGDGLLAGTSVEVLQGIETGKRHGGREVGEGDVLLEDADAEPHETRHPSSQRRRRVLEVASEVAVTQIAQAAQGLSRLRNGFDDSPLPIRRRNLDACVASRGGVGRCTFGSVSAHPSHATLETEGAYGSTTRRAGLTSPTTCAGWPRTSSASVKSSPTHRTRTLTRPSSSWPSSGCRLHARPASPPSSTTVSSRLPPRKTSPDGRRHPVRAGLGPLPRCHRRPSDLPARGPRSRRPLARVRPSRGGRAGPAQHAVLPDEPRVQRSHRRPESLRRRGPRLRRARLAEGLLSRRMPLRPCQRPICSTGRATSSGRSCPTATSDGPWACHGPAKPRGSRPSTCCGSRARTRTATA